MTPPSSSCILVEIRLTHENALYDLIQFVLRSTVSVTRYFLSLLHSSGFHF